MKSLAVILASTLWMATGSAQTPVTSFPYFYNWTNPAAFTLAPDGHTYVGGDGCWGTNSVNGNPGFTTSSFFGLVQSSERDARDTLFMSVDARGRGFSGLEVFTFDALRGLSATGSLQVFANNTLILSKTISADLGIWWQPFSAPLPPELGNSIFTIFVVVNTDRNVYFDNMRVTGGALPITLTSFQASFSAGSARMTWSTISEVDNYGFYVQKSEDGKNWVEVMNSFQPGSGTTTESRTYCFTDNSMPLGRYYRLHQVDLDGSSHYSDALSDVAAGIEAEPLAHSYALRQNYPNPFNPKTRIRYSVPTQSGQDGQVPGASDVTLVVYDLLGREVTTLVNETQQAGSYEVSFDGSGLASGTYVYRMSAGGFTDVKKMVLTR